MRTGKCGDIIMIQLGSGGISCTFLLMTEIHSQVCVCVQTSTTTSLNETLYPNLGMICPKKSFEVLVLDAFETTQ